MNHLPIIPEDQLQWMIDNALLQGMKQGPGAAPLDPTPYQLYLQSQQLQQVPFDPLNNF